MDKREIAEKLTGLAKELVGGREASTYTAEDELIDAVGEWGNKADDALGRAQEQVSRAVIGMRQIQHEAERLEGVADPRELKRIREAVLSLTKLLRVTNSAREEVKRVRMDWI